ncbi:hypothetical protein C8F04DRAFT_1270665 [Mycena alexandri]|uniref:Ribonuclease H1 N-terminal domain-containing protein n=1 Tax=Mycena alexandri TaxID=1745969 RepID=A0AAD6SBD3_9AGAR|nr:hypothetical protein C8F04DRAFT_1270665 [Mycena alexandri]
MSFHCDPVYRPSTGDEDPARHSHTAGLLFYTVGVGFVPGIYTRENIARDQVNGFSNGRWKKASTYDGAVQNWHEMCALYHNHSPSPLYSSLPPPPPASPSPPASRSPSPLGVSRTPAPRRGLTISSLTSTAHAGFFTISRTLPLSPGARPHVPPPRPANAPIAPRTPGRSGPTSSTLPHVAPHTPVRSSSTNPHFPHVAPRTPVRATNPHVAPHSPRMSRVEATRRSPSPRPSGSMVQIESARKPGEWKQGDRLWGIQGTPLLFEDRYEMIDHVFARHLSPALVMETRNRRKIEAFIEGKEYLDGGHDADESD